MTVIVGGKRIPLIRYMNSRAKAWDRGTVPNYTCSECGAPIYKNPSDVKKNVTGMFFCDHECALKSRRRGTHGHFAYTPAEKVTDAGY